MILSIQQRHVQKDFKDLERFANLIIRRIFFSFRRSQYRLPYNFIDYKEEIYVERRMIFFEL